MTDEPDRKAVLAELWAAGDLEYLLHEGQVSIATAFGESVSRRFVVNCSRRWGKSWLACVLAVMFALQRPKAQVRYAAPTQKMVRTIVVPLLREILDDCPVELRPTLHIQEQVWRFPNGSELHIAGADGGGAERLRGVSTDLAIVDEAGFVDELDYLVQDVLFPQLLTVDGRMLLISTPPRSPDHPFTGYCMSAEVAEAYAHATVYDAPHITTAQIEEYMREAGGKDSTTWRREYLAEFVVDEESAVVPEFSRVERDIVMERERPSHFFAWVAGDIGFYDLTVVLLAYVDFKAAKIVVENEIVMKRARSREINEAVRKAERETFGDRRPRERVIDAPAITVADMDDRELGMSWTLAAKDDADAALNALRMAIAERRVIIHPRCKTLIAHLRHAVWNKSRTSYERSADHGHFDGVDALKYLVRTVNVGLNPFPRLPEGVTHDTHHIRPPRRDKALAGLFRPAGQR